MGTNSDVSWPQLGFIGGFTARPAASRLLSGQMKLTFRVTGSWVAVAAMCATFFLGFQTAFAQEESQKPSAEKPVVTNPEKGEKPERAENPAQIELLEAKVRFEANGDSLKEVHTLVKINNELGVRQFARLNFDFNRSFESIEIPLVHITHANGGTADILLSAITDQPNPAVVNAPAYQDVRVKSVRILGLQPGDTLEYRVVRTVTHHPLAPDFWLDHTFDRTGVVSREIFELDLPNSRNAEVRINPKTPALSIIKSGEGDASRTTYRWEQSNNAESTKDDGPAAHSTPGEPNVVMTTEAWEPLSIRLDERLMFEDKTLEAIGSSEQASKLPTTRDVTPEIAAKARELTKGMQTNRAKLEGLYDFVSQKIKTVDLPLGVTGFVARPANAVLASGYATQEDKFVLFAALAAAAKLAATAALTGYCNKDGLARLSVFDHLLISASDGKTNYWLDPSLEVAPFGMVSPVSQKCAFVLNRRFIVMNSTGHEWRTFHRELPFAAKQRVSVDASLAKDGKLSARVKYTMRGDNELVLRLTFHQSPKEKWKEIAQLLSLTDGFRGQVTSVNASNPYATKQPFTVDYELNQPKFVGWSKEAGRIPALLPQLGLPEPSAKPSSGSVTAPIELGTPLEVETHMTLHLPPGTTATAPTGISVERDYATYSSQYSVSGSTLTATRHIKFILREIPGARAADYNAFLRAVQTDEAQDFTLERNVSSQLSSKP
jgi:transglutaminase-like putative cysteine protease